MALLTTPTQTTNINQGSSSRLELPVITAAAKEPETLPFVLETDTCGFMTGRTFTCDFGHECTNVGNYRGCCVADGTDCSVTMHTTCLDYEEMPNAAMCGPQTLCCPSSKAYCATYGFNGFMTAELPATFTHIRCAEYPEFGELYPYPPERTTTTKASDTEQTSDPLTAEPVNSTDSPSSKSISSGAIAGAVVGGIVFVFLILLGIALFLRRRRRQRQEAGWERGKTNNVTGPSTEHTRFGNDVSAGHLSSLSPIQEQHASSSPPTSPRCKRLSVSSIFRRQSLGQNWPLGPGRPASPRNPLSSHPVGDLENRLGMSDLPPQSQPNRHTGVGMPTLRTPTPSLRGTRLAPPPLKRPNVLRTATGSSLTNSKGSTLQSPRLSYIPPPVIDTTFREEVERRLTGIYEPGHGARRGSSSTNDDREPVSPLSPLNGDNDARGSHRISFVPTLNIPSYESWGGVDDVVSPISLDGGEGRASPMTVSPLESRHGSFGA